MNKAFALQLLQRMVEIPSLSGQEQQLAHYLQDVMTQLGLQSQIDEAGNVIGEGGDGDGPLILFLGHMDTVAGTIPVQQEGTVLYGRGTVDAKGPLATFICALALLKQTAGRLLVVGAVEEEVSGSKGTRAILQRYSPDAVVIGEPGGWSSIGLGYKGRIACTYTVTRPSVHTAAPGPTACELAIEFWQLIVEYCHSDGQSSIFHQAIPHLMTFEGSGELARITIDCRIPPSFPIDAFIAYANQIKGRGEVIIDEKIPAVIVERTNSLAQALSAAIWTYGVRAHAKVKTGTSDMNVVGEHWHVPMVAYGPGDSKLDHTPNEHIDLEEYWKAINVLVEAVQIVCAQYQKPDSAAGQAALQGSASASSPKPISNDVSQELHAEPVADYVYAQEEEEKLLERLQALGYLE